MKMHIEEAKKVFTKKYLKKIFKIEMIIFAGIQLVGTALYFMGLV